MRAAVLHSVLISGREEDYDREHREIPADLLALLRSAGVRDWAIWRDGRDLLHVIDTDDYEAVAERIAGHPADVRWQEQMAELVEGFREVDAIPPLRAPRLVWSMREQEER
ncbi:L-rhamnose mutarotase [Aeromicrobium camelliae]|uniref:L-rhamnose mutarotase n=1 Tax=Aeromicrobium camelliae TaxID=1538144 RepID=A0A3N6WVG8_9ACTN|nr:L-rhamnose mutarotase [Aeromicrobium camelliae]RQN09002.1 L-rhamnose mutarotase [Aeromicrobium camelliae]